MSDDSSSLAVTRSCGRRSGSARCSPTSNDGPPPILPLAAMVQGSFTNTRQTSGADPDNFPRNNDLVLQQLSAFYAGRIVEHFGAFVQWTYDGVVHQSSVDNVDIRAAGHFEGDGLDLSYGLTVNNNPTVSDIYNTTPAWSFPYASSSVAVAPNSSTLIDGGLAQQVAGTRRLHDVEPVPICGDSRLRHGGRRLPVFRAGPTRRPMRSSTALHLTRGSHCSMSGARACRAR